MAAPLAKSAFCSVGRTPTWLPLHSDPAKHKPKGSCGTCQNSMTWREAKLGRLLGVSASQVAAFPFRLNVVRFCGRNVLARLIAYAPSLGDADVKIFVSLSLSLPLHPEGLDSRQRRRCPMFRGTDILGQPGQTSSRSQKNICLKECSMQHTNNSIMLPTSEFHFFVLSSCVLGTSTAFGALRPASTNSHQAWLHFLECVGCSNRPDSYLQASGRAGPHNEAAII